MSRNVAEQPKATLVGTQPRSRLAAMYLASLREGMRQAVVVIHGIGEQRPMSTLREFVAHVVPASEENESRRFSKPDRMSASLARTHERTRTS